MQTMRNNEWIKHISYLEHLRIRVDYVNDIFIKHRHIGWWIWAETNGRHKITSLVKSWSYVVRGKRLVELPRICKERIQVILSILIDAIVSCVYYLALKKLRKSNERWKLTVEFLKEDFITVHRTDPPFWQIIL